MFRRKVLIPDAAPTYLHLPAMTRRNLSQATDSVIQRRTVHKHTERAQHLRNAVIWPIVSTYTIPASAFLSSASEMTSHEQLTSKHGQMVNVFECAIASLIECCPQICYEDLCPFEESDSLAFEARFILERRKSLRQQVDKFAG